MQLWVIGVFLMACPCQFLFSWSSWLILNLAWAWSYYHLSFLIWAVKWPQTVVLFDFTNAIVPLLYNIVRFLYHLRFSLLDRTSFGHLQSWTRRWPRVRLRGWMCVRTRFAFNDIILRFPSSGGLTLSVCSEIASSWNRTPTYSIVFLSWKIVFRNCRSALKMSSFFAACDLLVFSSFSFFSDLAKSSQRFFHRFMTSVPTCPFGGENSVACGGSK